VAAKTTQCEAHKPTRGEHISTPTAVRETGEPRDPGRPAAVVVATPPNPANAPGPAPPPLAGLMGRDRSSTSGLAPPLAVVEPDARSNAASLTRVSSSLQADTGAAGPDVDATSRRPHQHIIGRSAVAAAAQGSTQSHARASADLSWSRASSIVSRSPNALTPSCCSCQDHGKQSAVRPDQSLPHTTASVCAPADRPASADACP
jgi:hypothetical protein